MPTISGWTVNHNGSRRWPHCLVRLIDEATQNKVDETNSNGVGFFSFTVANTTDEYSIVANADNVRSGARSGIVAVP